MRKNKMHQVIKIEAGGFYLFESKSCGRNCYFETENEIEIFKVLFRRYVEKWVYVHKLYLSSEGYQILLRAKGRKAIRDRFRNQNSGISRSREQLLLKEPWRILSEQIRKFHSLYVRAVNKMRGRKGVLVQSRYNRYCFESQEEYIQYENSMKSGEEIKGQENERYRVSEKWKKGVRWGLMRSVKWVESASNNRFNKLVILILIEATYSAHFSPPPP